MASSQCPREPETIRAAWNADGVPHPEVAAHLAACPQCAEVAALARALRGERDCLEAAATPPSAGLVWWRAQRRAKEEAARKAARPIAIVHGVALGCTAAGALAVVGLGRGAIETSLAAMMSFFSWSPAPLAGASDAVAALPIGVMLPLAAVVVLAPVALYLAVSQK